MPIRCLQKAGRKVLNQEAMSDLIVQLNSGTFRTALERKVVLVEFWEPWCGPCQIQLSVLEEVARRVAGQAIVAKVNVDEAQKLAAHFGIQSLPTLVLFKKGKLARRFLGTHSAVALTAAIQDAARPTAQVGKAAARRFKATTSTGSLRTARTLMKAGNIHSRPTTLVRTTARISRGHQRVDLPVWIASGHQAGPTGLLSAGIHGDEVHAITLLHRFVRQLDLKQLTGRLLIVPVANVSGFHAGSRTVPEDGRDLNRCFPGNPRGTFSERIAHFIFTELAAAADWGVDLHDSGAGSLLLPHARVHDQELVGPGAAFGTEILMKTTLPPGYHGIFSIEARKHYQRPFFHIEVGGGAVLWEHLIKTGLTGLRNLLIYEGMLPGKLVLPRRQFFLPGRDDLARPAPLEGLLTQHVALGQAVTKGEPLATIENPLNNERAVIRAQTNGVVHDLNVRAKVSTGEDVVGVIGFGAFHERTTKPWRNSMERKTNHPGKTVSIHGSESLRPDKLCWICRRSWNESATRVVKKAGRKRGHIGLQRLIASS
jgi:thioredoxin